VLSDFRKIWQQGFGKLAAVYFVSLFGFVIWVGLLISWLFFSGFSRRCKLIGKPMPEPDLKNEIKRGSRTAAADREKADRLEPRPRHRVVAILIAINHFFPIKIETRRHERGLPAA